MGSPWTDESAILRDLSVAQGRWVPGGIDSAVAGGKPPAHMTEETEEEFYQRWGCVEPGGHGDFSAGADLFEIKSMLELMQDAHSPVEEFLSGPIEIVKLNPQATNFVPKTEIIRKEHVKPVNKPRRARNVAIASIMALALSQEPPKLAKPEDFIKPSKEDQEIKERRKDSVNKVTNWLQSQDITPMFKKKSSVNSIKDEQPSPTKKRSPVHSGESGKSPLGQYSPSVWAQQYYVQAAARAHVRDLVQGDVWRRAEDAMKEIDKRKQEAAAELSAEIARQCQAFEAMATSSDDTVAKTSDVSSRNSDRDEAEGVAKVLLASHRHTLYPAAACVVCATLAV